MRAWIGIVLGGLLLATAGAPPAAAEATRLAQIGRAEGRGDRADRERARRECARAAERRDFEVRGSTPARELEDRRLRLRMDLARRGERWLGTCTFDARARRAELETSRVSSGRPGGGRPGGGGAAAGGGSSASAREVRDACIREVSQNARTQLVATGRVERRSGGSSVMPMTINVEGNERRVRCFHDARSGAVTIR